jgi:hypothetical protein
VKEGRTKISTITEPSSWNVLARWEKTAIRKLRIILEAGETQRAIEIATAVLLGTGLTVHILMFRLYVTRHEAVCGGKPEH